MKEYPASETKFILHSNVVITDEDQKWWPLGTRLVIYSPSMTLTHSKKPPDRNEVMSRSGAYSRCDLQMQHCTVTAEIFDLSK